MTIPAFGWVNDSLPDITAANLEAMHAASGAYTDGIFIGAVGIPASFYEAKPSATAAQNTTGINNALAALPARGGRVLLASGQYLHEGIACKERNGVSICGMGGKSGGGGIGGSVPGVTEPATVLADVRGAGTARSIDMRKGIACKLEHLEAMVFNEAFPAAAPIWDLTSHQKPGCVDVTIQSTAEPGKLIPAVWGVALQGICNSGCFIDLDVKGCAVSVIGPTAGGEESVAHSFYNFCSYGHQQAAIVNPHQDWNFFGGSIEEKRNNKGELAGAGAVQCTIDCYSCTFFGTWIGGDKVSLGETGVQILWRGKDLKMIGGQLSNAATLIECAAACDRITLDGTAVALATNLIKLVNGVERVDLKTTTIAGFAAPTNVYAGTSNTLGWLAKTERAAATAFTPSTKGDTEVLLTFKTKAEATLAEIAIGGVVVTEVAAGAAATTLTATIKVPAGQTWEVKNKTGTVEKIFSSYRFV